MNARTPLFLVLAVALSGCTLAKPDAGEEAVLVKKPLLFGHGGVDPEPVKTGLTICAITTFPTYVDMKPIQFREHFDDLMSSDGVPLDFDAYVRLQVTDSVELIRDFGEKWYESNVQSVLRNAVRNAVKVHGMNETAISTTAAEDIDKAVTDALAAYLKSEKLPIRLLAFTAGKANPPDSVKHQRIETATQEQRIKTEAQRKQAEDARKDAELSRAAADNAYRERMQLSPEQFLALERIKMQREVCVGGKCTFLMGTGVVPTLDVR